MLREAAQVKYAVIHSHVGQFKLRLMCRVLNVSPSGYYEWRNRAPSSAEQQRALLDLQVQVAFEAEKGRAGSPRVVRRLEKKGHRCCRHQVAQSMRRKGLRAKAAREFKATTNPNHSLPVAPNLLQQDFSAERPNQKWVSDITYIPTDEGWLYLAVVLDLYSRRVVGWSMSARMTATLVCDALRRAIFNRQRPRGVIVHSDRGSQYCSKEHRTLLDEYDMLRMYEREGQLL